MTKEIDLTQGKVALVDDNVYEELVRYNWTADKHRKTCYARRNIPVNGKKVKVYMHRQILGLKQGDGTTVDHINHDGLDNRHINLRIVSHATNLRHRNGLQPNNTSGYTGVWWSKQGKKWCAEIKMYGKKIYLGSYKNILDAAKARKRGELKYW